MAAISFCGCSITGFNSRLGWGSNKSSLEVSVVEDTRNGDLFNPPPLGTPCYFYFGPSFYFWGLLQSWVQNNSPGGLGLYSLTVEDPRELLMGTQIITNNYNGSTYGVPNILNCFGYLEDQLGYGGADANEGGMPWVNIVTAIQTLTNNPQGAYGGPLQFCGFSYAIDLSNLPVPPPYYRLGGGPSMSLLDAIQQICDDGGCDFFVQLDPGVQIPVIRIYTVSRYAQPPLGTIGLITNNNWGGTVVRANNGLELRNEVSTHFLIGGYQNTLYTTEILQPFWGYDSTGQPVENLIANIPGLGYCNCAWVNTQEVAYVFNDGSTEYLLTEFECRAALVNEDTWLQYLNYEANVSGFTKLPYVGPNGILSPFDIPTNPKLLVVTDLIKELNAVGDTTAQLDAQHNLYIFVRSIATKWYGKQFWVTLPFIMNYIDPNNLTIHNSWDIADAGYEPLAGAGSLGLSQENLLKYMTDDGRYEPLAIYNPAGISFDETNPSESVLQNNGFFTKISVDKSIFIWQNTGIPACLITVSDVVKQNMGDFGEDIRFLATLFQQDNAEDFWAALQGRKAFGHVYMKVEAPRYTPMAVTIPLQSNVLTYGPWYALGAPGKVMVEQASDLTPWEYGTEDFMNQAAIARVSSAITFMQQGETGAIELVGMPMTSLGQTLMAGGPTITNMEVHYGKEGLTTSYQFRAFTDLHLNRFIRGTQEKLKVMGRTQNELRKSALLALSAATVGNTVNQDMQGAYNPPPPKWVMSTSSPLPVFIASTTEDPSTGHLRTSASIVEAAEGWAGIGKGRKPDSTLFANSSLCSVSAIIRPFTMGTSVVPVGVPNYLPVMYGVNPNAYSQGYPAFNASTLNPYQDGHTDIEYIVNNGNSYVAGKGVNWSTANPVAISAPLILCGWGYDIYNNEAPALTAPESQYKVGPVDLLWDGNRNMWSVRDSLIGTMAGDCSPSGTASMSILGAPITAPQLIVSNVFGTTVKAGKRVCVNYQPYLGEWVIVAADCP